MTSILAGVPVGAFDLETTSTDPETARIVTASVIVMHPSEPRRNNTWLVAPDFDIPEAATAVHGISTAAARQYGQPGPDVIRHVREWLYWIWAKGWPVIGHNVVYDLTLLDRELARLDEPTLEIRGPVLDSMILDKAADTYRKGSRQLGDVADLYGVDLGNEAHTSQADAVASAGICQAICEKYATKLPASIEELAVYCGEQFRAQKKSFAAYLESKGKSLDDMSMDWPLKHRP